MRDMAKTVQDAGAGVLLKLLAFTSFLLYAFGALTLHQDRSPGWSVEADFAIPIAVSYVKYGAPLGAFDLHVWESFHRRTTSVQEALSTAAQEPISRGGTVAFASDGDGVGMSLFTTIAMATFGINFRSLVLLYLTFVGISVISFLCRYRDQRLFAVILYFLAVTVMLLTPICMSQTGVQETPIGGNRYFVLAAFLPALHIFFELIESHRGDGYKLGIVNGSLLLTQAILLFAAILVRSSTGYLLGPLILVLAWRLMNARQHRERFIPLASKAGILAAALAFWTLFVVAAMPAYVKSGRVLGTVWDRMFISLHYSSEWPFGNLAEVYDCTKHFPKGLSRDANDDIGHCIWWSSGLDATRPAVTMDRDINGSEYEKILRDAFFYVLGHYPRQVVNTFVYTKSTMIKNTLAGAWSYLFELWRSAKPLQLRIVLAAQLTVFFGCIIAVMAFGLPVLDIRFAVFPVFFLLSLAPLYVAWANPWVSNDTIFLMYVCLALVLPLSIHALTRIVALIRDGRILVDQGRPAMPLRHFAMGPPPR
jgi:hypothetical protein